MQTNLGFHTFKESRTKKLETYNHLNFNLKYCSFLWKQKNKKKYLQELKNNAVIQEYFLPGCSDWSSLTVCQTLGKDYGSQKSVNFKLLCVTQTLFNSLSNRLNKFLLLFVAFQPFASHRLAFITRKTKVRSFEKRQCKIERFESA